MIGAKGAGAQCGAMLAASLLALRPLFVGYEWDGAARALSALAALAVFASALAALGGLLAPRALAPPPSHPFAGRPARRLSVAARALAALGVLASLAARLHDASTGSGPALFWLAALAALVLAAWACLHLRASLVRARFFWALGLGMLLAVVSSLDRPDAFARAPSGPQRLEPGPGVNLVLGVGALLLGEAHPGAELFALVPLYAPASSAAPPRTPWFSHLAALAAALAVGLAVLGFRHARLGPRGVSFVSALFCLLALGLIAIPMIAMPTFLGPLDGAALWLLSGAAALFAPAREASLHEAALA